MTDPDRPPRHHGPTQNEARVVVHEGWQAVVRLAIIAAFAFGIIWLFWGGG